MYYISTFAFGCLVGCVVTALIYHNNKAKVDSVATAVNDAVDALKK